MQQFLIFATSTPFGLCGDAFEAFEHEAHLRFPTLGAQIDGLGADVVEHPFLGKQLLMQKLVIAGHLLQHGVGQKRQDDEPGQQ